MPEIKIEKLTTQKDKVFFPGAAVLSDREAEGFQQKEQDENETEKETSKTQTKKGK